MDLINVISILHGQTATAVLTDSLSRILTRYSRYKQTKSSNEATMYRYKIIRFGPLTLLMVYLLNELIFNT